MLAAAKLWVAQTVFLDGLVFPCYLTSLRADPGLEDEEEMMVAKAQLRRRRIERGVNSLDDRTRVPAFL